MANSDSLYLLIKSLTKSEKRYFKAFSGRHKNNTEANNSVILFDAYEKLNIYDEKKLNESLNGTVVFENLKLNRFYLHRQIMKSLELFHAHMDTDVVLQSTIHQIKILFKKSLNHQALLVLKKAKKIATETAKHSYMVELIKLEYELRGTGGFSNTNSTPTSLSNELAAQNDMNKEASLYLSLQRQLIFLISKKGIIRSGKDKILFKEVMNNTLLRKKRAPVHSFWSAFYYHYSYALYYGVFNEHEQAYLHNSVLIKMINQHPDFNSTKVSQQNTIISNQFTLCSFLKKYDEAQQHVNTLFMLSTQRSALPASRLSAYYLQCKLHNITGDFLKAEKVAEKMIKELDGGGINYLPPTNRTAVYYEISKTYFSNEKYIKANAWLNKIFDEMFSSIEKSRHYGFKIYRLILYYEMQKNDLLEYELKSTYRLLLQQKKLYRFEEAILMFIRDAIKKIKTKKELTNSFKKLRDKLMEISEDKFEANALIYFDFISWLESKIEDKPFAEIVMRNARA